MINEIDAGLAEVGWKAEKTVRGPLTIWNIAIEIGPSTRYITVFAPTKSGSVVAASKILSPKIDGKLLDLLPAEVLRTFLRLQSEGGLASVMYLDQGTYAATAIHRGPSIAPSQLRLLVLDAATLASRIDAALNAA